MPVPVMGISTLPIEMISCEDETKEKPTLFTSTVDFETCEEDSLSLRCASLPPRPLLRLVAEAEITTSPPSLHVGVSSMPHDLLEEFHFCT